jgi:hypothetical protein
MKKCVHSESKTVSIPKNAIFEKSFLNTPINSNKYINGKFQKNWYGNFGWYAVK